MENLPLHFHFDSSIIWNLQMYWLVEKLRCFETKFSFNPETFPDRPQSILTKYWLCIIRSRMYSNNICSTVSTPVKSLWPSVKDGALKTFNTLTPQHYLYFDLLFWLLNQPILFQNKLCRHNSHTNNSQYACYAQATSSAKLFGNNFERKLLIYHIKFKKGLTSSNKLKLRLNHTSYYFWTIWYWIFEESSRCIFFLCKVAIVSENNATSYRLIAICRPIAETKFHC